MSARADVQLLTAEEVVVLVRLDEGRDVRCGLRALSRYRTRGLIKGCRVGRSFRYTEAAVADFIHRRMGVNGA